MPVRSEWEDVEQVGVRADSSISRFSEYEGITKSTRSHLDCMRKHVKVRLDFGRGTRLRRGATLRARLVQVTYDNDKTHTAMEMQLRKQHAKLSMEQRRSQ